MFSINQCVCLSKEAGEAELVSSKDILGSTLVFGDQNSNKSFNALLRKVEVFPV